MLLFTGFSPKVFQFFSPTDKPGKPGVPEIESVKVNQVSLSWKPPKDDGGSPVINYILEHKADGAYKWKRSTVETIEDTKYTLKGIAPETSYEFRVAAENKAGVGPFSQSTMPVKPQEKQGRYLLPNSE